LVEQHSGRRNPLRRSPSVKFHSRAESRDLVALEPLARLLVRRAVNALVGEYRPAFEVRLELSPRLELRPVSALLFALPTPRSVLPFVRARYEWQARGTTSKSRQNASNAGCSGTVQPSTRGNRCVNPTWRGDTQAA
jgi:hypothetical protein